MCNGLYSPAEGIRSPDARVAGRCEPFDGCWKPKLGPLQDQKELLAAEPSLQLWFVIVNVIDKILKPRLPFASLRFGDPAIKQLGILSCLSHVHPYPLLQFPLK